MPRPIRNLRPPREQRPTYEIINISGALPPYISLKQPFAITDLAVLEDYSDELAAHISSFDVALTHLQPMTTPTDKAVCGIIS